MILEEEEQEIRNKWYFYLHNKLSYFLIVCETNY
jgi:hypothetical protein